MELNIFSHNISFETVQKDTEKVLRLVLDEMSAYLELPSLYQHLQLEFNQESKLEPKFTDIFSIGVKRRYHNKSLIITFNEEYKKFFEFILLRELYNLFIPYEIRHYEWIQLIINQILINDLDNHPLQETWRDTIREHIEHRESLPLGTSQWQEYDILNWIFQNSYKIEIDGRMVKINQGAYQFFFHYIRKDPGQLPLEIEYPSNLFFDNYLHPMFKPPVDDEFVETLWSIIQIFYNVKTYRNMLEYKTYFNEFKQNGILNTDLSFRKFTAHMERIKYASFIAPNYYIVPHSIDLIVLRVYIQFNPLLPRSKILRVIQLLPFCTNPMFSYYSFAITLNILVRIPRVYQKDFIRFFERLRDDGYVIKVQYLFFEDSTNITNLNYLREFTQNRRLIDKSLTHYDKKFEICTNYRFGGEFTTPDLTLLDYLVLDMIQLNSVTGLGFERRRDTTQRLRNELSIFYQSQEKDLIELQKVLDTIFNSSQWKSELLELIDNNKQAGFFYLKSYIEDINQCVDILLKLLEHNKSITNFTQLDNILNNFNMLRSLDTRVLFTKSVLKDIVFQEFMRIYFKSKSKFKKKVEQFQTYAALLNSFYNFKPPRLDSLKHIIINENIKEFIVEDRQEKIKQLAKEYRLYSLTSQDIEDTISKLLQRRPSVISPSLIRSLEIIENMYVIHIVLHDTKRVRNILNNINYIGIYFGIFPYRTLGDERLIWTIVYIPAIPTAYMNLCISTLYRLFADDLIMSGRSYGESWENFGTAKSFYDFMSK
ncbi:MAG: hypothetical protein ACFFHD_05175, partial [Promethearchaeota archaeon]